MGRSGCVKRGKSIVSVATFWCVEQVITGIIEAAEIATCRSSLSKSERFLSLNIRFRYKISRQADEIMQNSSIIDTGISSAESWSIKCLGKSFWQSLSICISALNNRPHQALRAAE